MWRIYLEISIADVINKLQVANVLTFQKGEIATVVHIYSYAWFVQMFQKEDMNKMFYAKMHIIHINVPILQIYRMLYDDSSMV